MNNDAPSVALAASAFAASEALNDFFLRLVSEPNPDRWHMGLLTEVNDMAAILNHVSTVMAWERRAKGDRL
jgi:hypothetical protein